MVTREYTTEGLTVTWDASRCIHTGICLRSLPEVFDLDTRPWVTVDGAAADQVVNTIRKCPTGALRYHRDGDDEVGAEPTTMYPVAGGPMLVRGQLRVVNPSTGAVIAEEARLALCRCGQSQNQPFCDNSHRRVGFAEASADAPADRGAPSSPREVCPPQAFTVP